MNSSRHYTIEEKQKLQQLLKEGLSHYECGQVLNRTRASITCEVYKGIKNGKYDWEVSEINSYKYKSSEIHRKISFLEMQVEILTDQIRMINERYIKNK